MLKKLIEITPADMTPDQILRLQFYAIELQDQLKIAVKYLHEGKMTFSPHTTNSFVDDFLEKHRNLL